MTRECDCGAIPVLDFNGERLVGMITDRDICMCTWMQNAPPRDLSVSQAMSRELHACSPEDDVASAEQLMRSRQVRRIPVVDQQGRLAGILSLADIVRRSERERGRREREIPSADITETLAGIVQPTHRESPARPSTGA